MSDSNIYDDVLRDMPTIPPKTTISFHCKDCDCVWTFGIEDPISFERFYQKNKECMSCGKSNIEIDIIPVKLPPIE